MPGSGKSTLGEGAAKQTGATFLDLDGIIVRLAGMTIPEIFAKEGEAGFRARETEALRAVADGGDKTDPIMQGFPYLDSGSNLILATGGGVVTRPENLEILRRIGTILYLYRSPETLLETCAREGGRPLLADPERFQALWEARKEIYPRWADHTVDADGPFQSALDRLIDFLLEL